MVTNEQEEWKSIPGYEGLYEASNMGRIRRLTYRNRNVNRVLETPIIMKQCPLGPYLRVTLSRDGIRISYSVHSLILLAFVGPRPRKYGCAHGDGNPTNNALSNLRWATATENEHDKIQHGTYCCGEKQANSKLTAAQVMQIRKVGFTSPESLKDLAETYGVTTSNIKKIVARIYWRHLP